jgi:hypothetical protein
MSTFSSKQENKQVPAEVLLMVAFIIAIVILVVPGVDARNLNTSIRSPLTALSPGWAGSLVPGGDVSFTSDEQYWSKNCSHGWTSDSTCNEIVSRVQICERIAGSAYCSEYEAYMQQFQRRPATDPGYQSTNG